jgi:hypothetical protein
LVEEVVSFDDFYVWRVTLEKGGCHYLPEMASYALVICVSGICTIGNDCEPLETGLLPEQSAFITRVGARNKTFISNKSDKKSIVLVSLPK